MWRRKLRRPEPVRRLPGPSQPRGKAHVGSSARRPHGAKVTGTASIRAPKCLELSSASSSDSDSLDGFIVQDEIDGSSSGSTSNSDDECGESNSDGESAFRRSRKRKHILSSTRPSLYESQESELAGSPVGDAKRRRASPGAAPAKAGFTTLTPSGSASPALSVAATPAALTNASACGARRMAFGQQGVPAGLNAIISPPAVAADGNRASSGKRKERSIEPVPSTGAAFSSPQGSPEGADKLAAAKLVSARTAVHTERVHAYGGQHLP